MEGVDVSPVRTRCGMRGWKGSDVRVRALRLGAWVTDYRERGRSAGHLQEAETWWPLPCTLSQRDKSETKVRGR